MGKTYEEIDTNLAAWIRRQHMFFVATAPSRGQLINCSPKGLDTLHIMGPRELAYIDLGGSGIETVAHVKENVRIVIMMCAFEGPPKIFRFYGNGTVVEPHQPEFATLLAAFPEPPVCRAIIRIAVTRIQDSCGYGVPLYDFKSDRESMSNYLESKSPEQLQEGIRKSNATSLENLPGLALRSGMFIGKKGRDT
jgi:hypothetical protein